MDFLLDNNRVFLKECSCVPVHLRRYAIVNAQCRYKKFEEGEVLSQLLLGNDFSIWMHHFFIRSNVVLHGVADENVLTLFYLLRGNLPSVVPAEGHYTLLCMRAGVMHNFVFVPGNFFIVHVNFHPCHFIPIAQQYPVFEPMLSVVNESLLSHSACVTSVITPPVSQLINELIRCDLDLAERSLLLESRVRDLLRLYVADQASQVKSLQVTDVHVKLLHKVESFILSHLDQDCSVDRLALHAGVSKSWLQQIAHKHYGKGIYSVVREMRMKEASRLLLTTDKSVSEIAMIVSDMTFASFSSAFYSYFKQSPSSYRENGGRLP